MARKIYTTADVSLTRPCYNYDADGKRINNPASYMVAVFHKMNQLDWTNATDADGNEIEYSSEGALFALACASAYKSGKGGIRFVATPLKAAMAKVKKYDPVKQKTRKRSAWLSAVCLQYNADPAIFEKVKPLNQAQLLEVMRQTSTSDTPDPEFAKFTDLYEWSGD